MPRTFPTFILIVAVATALTGCVERRVFIRDGNANSVELAYRGDVASTLPRARQHCAQFERVPVFVEANGEVAVYDCRPP